MANAEGTGYGGCDCNTFDDDFVMNELRYHCRIITLSIPLQSYLTCYCIMKLWTNVAVCHKRDRI